VQNINNKMSQSAEPITTNNSDVNPTNITETDVLNELLKYQWTIEQEEGQPIDLDIDDDEEEFDTEDDNNSNSLDPLKKKSKESKKTKQPLYRHAPVEKWPEEEPEEHKLMIDVSNGNRGVLKRIIKEGTGELPEPNSRITIHYIGKIAESGAVFDSSRERTRPEEIKLGEGMITEGWELSLLSMKQGEMSRFYIFSNYGYGDLGCPPRIPARSNLLFEIEMLNIERIPLPVPLEKEESFEERIKKKLQLRKRVEIHFIVKQPIEKLLKVIIGVSLILMDYMIC